MTSQLPKTKKGLTSFIRKIVQEELDERAEQDTGVVQVMTPAQVKAQQRQAELDEMYRGVEL